MNELFKEWRKYQQECLVESAVQPDEDDSWIDAFQQKVRDRQAAHRGLDIFRDPTAAERTKHELQPGTVVAPPGSEPKVPWLQRAVYAIQNALENGISKEDIDAAVGYIPPHKRVYIYEAWRQHQQGLLNEVAYGDSLKHQGHPAITLSELGELKKSGLPIPSKYLRQVLSAPTHPGLRAKNGKLSIAAQPTSRLVLNVDVGGTIQPFYRSSGTGHLPKEVYLEMSPDQIKDHPKWGKRTGNWNPFSGIGGTITDQETGNRVWASDWFNKNVYGHYNRVAGDVPDADKFVSLAAGERFGSDWYKSIAEEALNQVKAPLQWSIRAISPEEINTKFINNQFTRSLHKKYKEVTANAAPGSVHAREAADMRAEGGDAKRFNKRMEMEGQILPEEKPKAPKPKAQAGREAAETVTRQVAGGTPESKWWKYAKKLGKAVPVAGAALTAYDVDQKARAAKKGWEAADTWSGKAAAVAEPALDFALMDLPSTIKNLPDASETYEELTGETPGTKVQTRRAKHFQQQQDKARRKALRADPTQEKPGWGNLLQRKLGALQGAAVDPEKTGG